MCFFKNRSVCAIALLIILSVSPAAALVTNTSAPHKATAHQKEQCARDLSTLFSRTITPKDIIISTQDFGKDVRTVAHYLSTAEKTETLRNILKSLYSPHFFTAHPQLSSAEKTNISRRCSVARTLFKKMRSMPRPVKASLSAILTTFQSHVGIAPSFWSRHKGLILTGMGTAAIAAGVAGIYWLMNRKKSVQTTQPSNTEETIIPARTEQQQQDEAPPIPDTEPQPEAEPEDARQAINERIQSAQAYARIMGVTYDESVTEQIERGETDITRRAPNGDILEDYPHLESFEDLCQRLSDENAHLSISQIREMLVTLHEKVGQYSITHDRSLRARHYSCISFIGNHFPTVYETPGSSWGEQIDNFIKILNTFGYLGKHFDAGDIRRAVRLLNKLPEKSFNDKCAAYKQIPGESEYDKLFHAELIESIPYGETSREKNTVLERIIPLTQVLFNIKSSQVSSTCATETIESIKKLQAEETEESWNQAIALLETACTLLNEAGETGSISYEAKRLAHALKEAPGATLEEQVANIKIYATSTGQAINDYSFKSNFLQFKKLEPHLLGETWEEKCTQYQTIQKNKILLFGSPAQYRALTPKNIQSANKMVSACDGETWSDKFEQLKVYLTYIESSSIFISKADALRVIRHIPGEGAAEKVALAQKVEALPFVSMMSDFSRCLENAQAIMEKDQEVSFEEALNQISRIREANIRGNFNAQEHEQISLIPGESFEQKQSRFKKLLALLNHREIITSDLQEILTQIDSLTRDLTWDKKLERYALLKSLAPTISPAWLNSYIEEFPVGMYRWKSNGIDTSWNGKAEALKLYVNALNEMFDKKYFIDEESLPRALSLFLSIRQKTERPEENGAQHNIRVAKSLKKAHREAFGKKDSVFAGSIDRDHFTLEQAIRMRDFLNQFENVFQNSSKPLSHARTMGYIFRSLFGLNLNFDGHMEFADAELYPPQQMYEFLQRFPGESLHQKSNSFKSFMADPDYATAIADIQRRARKHSQNQRLYASYISEYGPLVRAYIEKQSHNPQDM